MPLRFSCTPPAAELEAYLAGADLVKAAGDPEVAYNLYGTLRLSSTGWLVLGVPNAVVRGVFAAMHERGAELPPGPDGALDAHVSVMSPEDLESVGGGDVVNERGKQFAYTLGRLMAVDADASSPYSKVWYLRVHSPELQEFRRSYGLPSFPHGGDYDFHVTVAVRRRGVLGRNEVAKGTVAG